MCVPPPTCHSDGEVPGGLFVSPEDTDIKPRVLVGHICNFDDGAPDLNTGRGQDPGPVLVPVEGHAGPAADVAAQLEDGPRLQQEVFGGVLAQLLQNICRKTAALSAFFSFNSSTFLSHTHTHTSKPVIPSHTHKHTHTPFRHPLNYDLQLLPETHPHQHTMKLPWRPGGLTNPILLHRHTPSQLLQHSPATTPPPPPPPHPLQRRRKEKEGLELMNTLQRDSGHGVNLRGGEGSLKI